MFKRKIVAALLMAVLSCAALTIGAVASPALDDLGTALPESSSSSVVSDNPLSGLLPEDNSVSVNTAADNIGDVFSGAGLTGEDIEKAKETITPLVKFVNYGLGILVALLGTILLAVTILDMLYIVSPSFIRNIGGGDVTQAGGMNGMGGMGQAPAPQKRGFAALISDDCLAALNESGAGAAGGAPAAGAMPMGGGFNNGFGGGFGGGFNGGMGGMGAPAASPAPKAKAVIAIYLKKRVFTLVLIGVCVVVLTCTCFLDVGMKIGMWITGLVSGIV